jgi:predicted amino acid-binding ACT domain protein
VIMTARKKIKLEDAIRTTNMQVDINEANITLMRKAYRSAKCTSPLANYAQQQLYSDESNLGYEGKYWKRQCEALLQDRVTVVEKLGSLLKQYDNQLCRRSAQVIDVYKTLTGISVDCTSDGYAICTVKNAVDRKGTVFGAVLNADDTVTLQPRANVAYLPKYMQQEEITCDAVMVPVVLRDTLQEVFRGLQADDESGSSETDSLLEGRHTSSEV